MLIFFYADLDAVIIVLLSIFPTDGISKIGLCLETAGQTSFWRGKNQVRDRSQVGLWQRVWGSRPFAVAKILVSTFLLKSNEFPIEVSDHSNIPGLLILRIYCWIWRRQWSESGDGYRDGGQWSVWSVDKKAGSFV